MNQPAGPRYNNLDITPMQIAKELLTLARALADAIDDLDEIEKAVEEAGEAYTMADAAAKLKANDRSELTAADLRKAWSDQQTSEERLAYNVAKAVVRARKLRIEVLKTRVSVGQSVARALETELNLDALRRR